MHFEAHEKAIYSPESRPDLRYDPLDLDRKLTIISGGKFGELIDRYRPIEYGPDGLPTSGDTSPEGVRTAKVDRAKAEAELVTVVREAFTLPNFPECTDGTVLEVLHDYLWWMEKKGSREEMTPISPLLSDSSLPETN